MYFKTTLVFSLVSPLLLACLSVKAVDVNPELHDQRLTPDANKLVIWGQQTGTKNTDIATPTSELLPEDMISINASTSEDLVSYEPSLVIRKRFIGDSNGTIGIRGSNMFQTSRSMVFADGIPLHYLLQTRWSGAPRWSLVSADEIAFIKTIYGPFSAEYSGNTMGGAVIIETAIPTERRIHMEGSLFSQNFQLAGFDKNLQGYKGFFSYEDKFDSFSLYASYNHLENSGHPQTFRFTKLSENPSTPPSNAIEVQGAITGEDNKGNPVLYFGDNGITESITDNYKIKLGYDFEKWSTLLTLAYEDRNSQNNQANNYLAGADGAPVWNATVVQDGQFFSIRDSHFAESELNRRSLLLGLRAQGELNENWWLKADVGTFTVLQDQNNASKASLQSPNYTSEGQISDYDDTGWSTAEIKLQTDSFLSQDSLSFVTGLRHESYQLTINNYNSDDYTLDDKTELRSSSGGQTSISAAYAQLGWQIDQQWDALIGTRFESWDSRDGFFIDSTNDYEQPEARNKKRFSPKFSLGFKPEQQWQLRYSLAKAYRFPIVEELFQNERTTQGTSIANAKLAPESGFHQNLLLQKDIDSGYWRFNYFNETIDDVIVAQSSMIDNRIINTFLPIDKVKTKGLEFVYNQSGLFNNVLDIRLNTTYTDSTITKNVADPSIEGKDSPRMPKWRLNLLATFHLTSQWDLGGGIRYASNSYGEPDNSDTASNVFGAMDAHTLLNLKTSYFINPTTSISLGIDNVTDESVFVYHPWPQRTLYLNISLDI